MCDGANTNFKNAESQWKKIVNFRAKKICSLAIRTAGGNVESIDMLSDDEIEYFQSVVASTRDILNRVNNLRGKKTRDTHIDEDFNTPRVVAEPPKPVVAEALPVVVDDEFFDDGYDEPICDPEDFPMDEPPVVHDECEPAVVDSPVVTEDQQEETSIDPLSTEGDVEEVSGEFVPILIRILEDLPEFAGPFRTYRLSKEDLITMPKVMAESLVNNGKAVLVRPSS
jgi:DNA replication initiation complex subunit (GINS family)